MRSLNWKLGGALLLIAAISVGLMAYLTNINTTREFNQYLTQGNQRYVQNTSDALSQIYATEGNWANIQSLLSDLQRSTADRLVVVNATGTVIGDTGTQWLGQPASSVGLNNGTPIIVSGETTGEFYLITSQVGSGRGYMGGGRGGSGVTSATAVIPEQDFLSQTNRSLIFTGLISIAVALIIGLVLTRQMTRPIRALVAGVRQIARGNLSHRVKVKSSDELGNLGQSFNAMAASLEEAEQERKRIISDVAHELRTPLTIIEGTVSGIQDGVFQPDTEHLEVIKEQTSLLTRLTGDLRDLSLAESGQLKLNIVSTDVNDIVRRKIVQFQPKASDKKINMELNPAGVTTDAKIDITRINQVIDNLLTNAIRHTPPGGRITVSVQAVDKDDTHQIQLPSLIISVDDTGEGIAAEHLPHVFDRFYRVEKSRSKIDGGSGLGLAIVKQMVQAHGGKVWVKSEPGKGSTFYFSLPRIIGTA